MNFRIRVIVLLSYLCFVEIAFSQNVSKIVDLQQRSQQAYDSSNYQLAIKLAKEGLQLNELQPIDSIEIELLLTLSFSTNYIGNYDECQEYNYANRVRDGPDRDG